MRLIIHMVNVLTSMIIEHQASINPWMVIKRNDEIKPIPTLISDSFNSFNAISNLYYSFKVVGVHVVMLSYIEASMLSFGSTFKIEIKHFLV